jgi:hypothetical protein
MRFIGCSEASAADDGSRVLLQLRNRHSSGKSPAHFAALLSRLKPRPTKIAER